MKLVIDIPEEIYEDIKYNFDKQNYNECGGYLLSSKIVFGTSLPKGHGRLGDLDKIKKEMQNYLDDCAKTSEYTRLGFETAIAVVEDADAIVEADMKGE